MAISRRRARMYRCAVWKISPLSTTLHHSTVSIGQRPVNCKQKFFIFSTRKLGFFHRKTSFFVSKTSVRLTTNVQKGGLCTICCAQSALAFHILFFSVISENMSTDFLAHNTKIRDDFCHFRCFFHPAPPYGPATAHWRHYGSGCGTPGSPPEPSEWPPPCGAGHPLCTRW